VTEPMTFDPISRQTVSAQIREQLLRRITTGELGPGARVPSERELSEQFEVARTSVREAIQGLLSLGYIERRGNRTWVAEHLPEVAVRGGDDEKVFVRQLFETRRLLEVPIFALAAERSDDDDHAMVAALLARFDEPLSLGEFRHLDREFHTVIASTCGNPLLIELYGKVLDQLFRSSEFETLLGDERNSTVVARIVADAIDGHRAIFDAFAANDPVAMECAVVGHLDTIEHSMIDELG
jgi:GntR family transcriptional regulator, transcriptional repressor for pyruvate dehydrogenase complex